jgi:chromosome partitioning protein
VSRIITVASQKGGVGKTTTALNLGFSLGRFWGKTLVLEVDPQSGITIASNLRNRTKLGLIDLLEGSCEPPEVLCQARDGSITVAGVGEVTPDRMERFEQAGWDGSLGGMIRFLSFGFNYVIIDAPAGMTGVVHAALRESDGVILVANCSMLTLRTLPSFLSLIEHIAAYHNAKLTLEGVLLSMLDARNESELQLFERIQEVLPVETFFQTVVPYDERFAMASQEAIPAALVPSGEDLDRLYLGLAMELRERENVSTGKREISDEPRRLF